MTNFFTGSLRWALLIALNSLLSFADAQTITYTSAGVYTNVAPAGVSKATFKLWGAGGGGSAFITNQFPIIGVGGGGAFSSVTLDVQPGDTFVIVVGQRGSTNGAMLGGAGSGNTEGGLPGSYFGSEGRSQGGQASSAFFITNNLLLMKAVAGGGGGAGLGANGGGGGQPGETHFPAQGGQPGANGTGGFGSSGTAGANYNGSALTTGLSALNQADGKGGYGVAYSGGGGGGYGGGAGGTSDPMTSGSGGGGGGSYGTTVNFGAGLSPGNGFDTDYVGNAGRGGVPNAPGSDGLAVLKWISNPVPVVVNPALLADGSLRLSFTNVSGASFTTFGTTNISPVNWTSLGSATEISPGQFQFTDTQATNFPQRFYQIRSP